MNLTKPVVAVLALLLCASAMANPATESGCDVYLRSQQKFVPVKNLRVLDPPDASARLHVPGVDEADVMAVQCTRSSIVPVADDARVLAAGWPLYIATTRSDGSKALGTLEFLGGKLRFRMVKGELRGAEPGEVEQALKAIEKTAEAMKKSQS